MVARADAERWAASILASVSGSLKAAPGRLAPRCVGVGSVREARQILETAMQEVMGDAQAALADAQAENEEATE